jgi:antitoxin CcdA
MTTPVYDRGAPKLAVDVSIKSDLAAKARALGLNFSEALEIRLAEFVVTAERQKWLVENAVAIEAYNERVSEGAILSDFEQLY